MRNLLIIPILLAGCTDMRAMAPTFGPTIDVQAFSQRRGQVEVYVKSNHSAIMVDIANGSGDHIGWAMDIAGIPDGDRPARLIQLRSDQALYQTSPEALITALMVYS